MAYTAPLADMRFALREVAGLERIAALPGYEHATDDTVDAVLEEAAKLAGNGLAPLNRDGDKVGAKLENGVVRTAPGFTGIYKEFVDGGWNSLPFDPEFGGQGMPWLLATTVQEMWQAANMGFGLVLLLNQGAIDAIHHHGSPEQKAAYLPKMISGEWTGTMNLTEPQAGSDLGPLKSRAVKSGDHYLITGQKIFITYGEHDLTENIVHLVLARTPDAPAGVRGISLFIVPKFLPGPDGKVDVRAVEPGEKVFCTTRSWSGLLGASRMARHSRSSRRWAKRLELNDGEETMARTSPGSLPPAVWTWSPKSPMPMAKTPRPRARAKPRPRKALSVSSPRRS